MFGAGFAAMASQKTTLTVLGESAKSVKKRKRKGKKAH